MRLFALVLATMLPAAAAHAQTPPTSVIAGMVKEAGVVNDVSAATRWCRIQPSASTYQQDSGGPKLMSFGDVDYAVGSGGNAPPTFYKLYGQARLTFTTSNRGTVNFFQRPEYPADVRAPSFASYSESYDAVERSLRVRYVIRFPSCEVAVDATYRH